ncbi:uracil-DNA glycosylase [Asaia krungthepensis]|uniref:Bacteriophage-type DNA polymerase n=1 Tax=Asaia krungthepensis NRIC 0535 TaxID=1307925 RepID=A0ABQ0Q3H4_9PROT|nr:uracil-DNA glycosylase [Asaia krungthepensis]GBQ89607.1 bacteriophage-type DNA polymerase [Asaia krungthepensis NRIC 0535]
MSLTLSGQDRSEILALLELYREWGVDCLIDEIAPQRLDRPASVPARVSRNMPQRARAMPTAQVPPAATAMRPAPVDPEAAQIWGVESFPECGLARTASTSVRPLILPEAPLMLIGDAPDADEDRSGTVFAGETGRLLDMILPSIGLDRAALSQAPALPWRPPGGRAVSLIEMRECRALLHAAIIKARPRRLVLLGPTPLRLLTDEQASVARSRGKWLTVRLDDGHSVEALVLQHPQQLVSSARARREMWKDLVFLAECLEGAA